MTVELSEGADGIHTAAPLRVQQAPGTWKHFKVPIQPGISQFIAQMKRWCAPRRLHTCSASAAHRCAWAQCRPASAARGAASSFAAALEGSVHGTPLAPTWHLPLESNEPCRCGSVHSDVPAPRGKPTCFRTGGLQHVQQCSCLLHPNEDTVTRACSTMWWQAACRLRPGSCHGQGRDKSTRVVRANCMPRLGAEAARCRLTPGMRCRRLTAQHALAAAPNCAALCHESPGTGPLTRHPTRLPAASPHAG